MGMFDNYEKKEIKDKEDWGQLFLREDEEKYALLQGGLGVRKFHWGFREENARVSLHQYDWDEKLEWKRKKIAGTYNWLWLDFDYVSIEEIERRLEEEFPLKPNFLVRTGRGWHLIWSSEKKINNSDYLNKFDLLQFQLSKKLEADRQNLWNWYSRCYGTRHEEKKTPIRWFFLNENFYSEREIEEILSEVKNGVNIVEETNVLFDEMRVFKTEVEKRDFSLIYSFCNLLRELEKRWETHSYREWYLLSVIYALWGTVEKEKWNEFIQKSKRWQGHPVITPEDQLKNTIKYVQKKGILYPSCIRLSQEFDECKNCIYRKTKYSIFGILRKEKFEYVPPDNWITIGGMWAKITKTKDGDERIIPLSNKAFKIHKIEKLLNPEPKLSNMRDVELRLKIEVDNEIKDIELRNEYAEAIEWFLELKDFHLFREFIKELIKVNEQRVDTLKKFSGVRDFKENILGKDYFTSFSKFKEIECEVKGQSYEFWNTIRNEINKFDTSTLLAIGISLSGLLVASQKYEDISIRIAPNLILLGKRGVGKTTRGRIANAFWRHPNEYLYFPNTSKAFITNVLPILNGFAFIDELFWAGEKEKEELLYNMVSLRGRRTALGEFPNLYISYFLTGEIRNVDRFAGGLERRYLVLLMPEAEKFNNEHLFYVINKLTKNYGWVWEFAPHLKEKDFIEETRKIFEERIRDFKGELEEHFWFMCLYTYLIEELYRFLDLKIKKDFLDLFLERYEYSMREIEEDRPIIDYLKRIIQEARNILRETAKVDVGVILQKVDLPRILDERTTKLVLCDDMPYFSSARKFHYYFTQGNIFYYLTQEGLVSVDIDMIINAWNKKKRDLENFKKMQNDERLKIAKLWSELLVGLSSHLITIPPKVIEKIQNLLLIDKSDFEEVEKDVGEEGEREREDGEIF
jgi:hypothetical protein